MYTLNYFLIRIFLSLLITAPISSFAQEDGQEEDRTLSPYFFVQTENENIDQLPLLSTKADVQINGVIAEVEVRQVYKNSGSEVLEAIYIFPASTRAAVHQMYMMIGERKIMALIQKKEQARATYNEAKEAGKTTTLLEQQRPNVFQMNVANILPGDTVEVVMTYTEYLVPDDGIYEFVYPAVVGPRYSNEPAATASLNEKWIENPYTHAGEKPTYDFDISTVLQTGIPVKDLYCPSHQVDIEFDGASTAEILLEPVEQNGGNRDFILKYRLQGKEVETGMLFYEGKEENYFLMMMEPPVRPEKEQIVPREYIFIMDISGSMNGYPMETSKKLISDLVGNLKPTDLFNIILFAGGSTQFQPQSVPASQANLQKALSVINNQRGGGGTEIINALQRAYNVPGEEGFSRTIVIVTDGYVSVEKEVFDLIRENLNEFNVFSFGIGSSVNRYIIEGMGNAGQGESFVVTNSGEAPSTAQKFREYIQSPVLTDIQVLLEGFDAYDVEPLKLPDLFAQRPLMLFGKYRGSLSGKITIKGQNAAGSFDRSMKISTYSEQTGNKAIRYLWARKQISRLSDYGQLNMTGDLEEQITNLGLKYQLLTNYTSFVAVDSTIRNESGEVVVVKQPLPLPEGVSDLAVGNNVKLSHQMLGYNSSNVQEIQIRDDANKFEREPRELRVAEQMPQFPGGDSALQAYIHSNLEYPEDALEDSIEGQVYVEFTVTRKGKVRNVSLKRSVSRKLDRAALKVIRKMPDWLPGEHDGQKVDVVMVLPISFKL